MNLHNQEFEFVQKKIYSIQTLQRIQVGHADSWRWQTESYLVSKWLLCELCFKLNSAKFYSCVRTFRGNHYFRNHTLGIKSQESVSRQRSRLFNYSNLNCIEYNEYINIGIEISATFPFWHKLFKGRLLINKNVFPCGSLHNTILWPENTVNCV